MNYAEKKKELKVKYAEEIAFIECHKDMMPGVGFDKLKSWAKGIEPCPFVNEEELKKDIADLAAVAEETLKELEE